MIRKIIECFNLAYNNIRDLHIDWNWNRKLMGLLVAISFTLSIAYLYLKISPNQYLNVFDSYLGVATMFAFTITMLTVYQGIKLSKFLQYFIGLEKYTYEAAKGYLRAQSRVIGVLIHWRVSAILEYALVNCRCSEMVFVGKIELDDKLPGIMWRIYLNAERKKRSLEPMKIFHVEKTSLLFVVIDEETVLTEQIVGGEIAGKIEKDRDLATDYATIFNDIYYAPQNPNAIDAEQRIESLLYDYLRKLPKREYLLEDKKEELIGFMWFSKKTEYQRFFGKAKFAEMLEEYIRKVINNNQTQFTLSAQTGKLVLTII